MTKDYCDLCGGYGKYSDNGTPVICEECKGTGIVELEEED
jgi:DnaJ-class molecular chaperone